jgi:hypothetical protein
MRATRGLSRLTFGNRVLPRMHFAPPYRVAGAREGWSGRVGRLASGSGVGHVETLPHLAGPRVLGRLAEDLTRVLGRLAEDLNMYVHSQRI